LQIYIKVLNTVVILNQFYYNTDEVMSSMIKFVSERIAQRREELDMTQEDLARKIIEPGQKLDSVRNFIARVELGKNEPGAYRLAKIAEGLGIDMNYFFDGVRQLKPVVEEKPVVQEPLPSFEDVLKELRLKNSGRRAVVILEDRHIKSSREALEHLNIAVKPGQRAFVVVLDNVDDQKKAVINSAIGLMQGVKSVVDVPLNGVKDDD
jgi:transcriptional regulator with XRE-family HTH domain